MNRRPILCVLCVCAMTLQLFGAEPQAQPGSPGLNAAAPATPAGGTSAVSSTASSDDLQQLRQRIAQQEEAIKQLQKAVEDQRALLEKAVANSTAAPAAAKTVNVANDSTPVQLVPAVNVIRPRLAWGRQNLQSRNPSPLSINIGNTTFTPLGFVDATIFGRSTNTGNGIGTNYGSIPYNTSVTDHLSELNFSTQNSRIGFRVDSTVMGAKVLGYFEADFLGNQAASVFVTSNADTFRMRNIFADVEKNGFEILGGQDWSLATPNRKGLSPLPSDIFYTQNMDTNYQAGLVWARQTQFRFIAHPSDNFAFGASLENPQQYIGGSNGGSSISLPSAAAFNTALNGGQFNNGSSNYSAANLMPDIIFKAAYDGHVGANQIMHVEAVGMVRSFKDTFGVNAAGSPIATGTPAGFHSDTATAAAGEVNANLEVVKNFRIIANTYFGSGNGRYLLGQAPDVVIRANGSISPIHSYSTVDGFEANITKNTLLDAYYGGIYIGRDVTVDTNAAHSVIGYGYAGSPNGQNRSIQEGTIGITRTFWKHSEYGALSLITQYSYLTRDPWAVSVGAPKATHTNMYWLDLRYTLP